jgi:hypothetical protein
MADRPATAQAAYADMLRTAVAPRLRALGFKGSSLPYVLPDDDWWLIVGFQKSYHSTADSARFTVNLTAANKAAWAAGREQAPWLPLRPSGNLSYRFGKVVRLGGLMPPAHGDLWWEIGPGIATEPVALQVVGAIERHGLPWLRSQTGR